MKAKFLLNLIFAASLLTSFNLCGQDRYCLTFDDLLNGRWDTVSQIKRIGRSKGKQIWAGGNNYTMKTGDKAIDKILKKKALAVIVNDSLYINCLNLRFEKTVFGPGYAKAWFIGNKILFSNRLIGRDMQNEAFAAGYFLGAIGGAIVASEQRKNIVCYIISEGEDKKGRINIQLIDDNIMAEFLEGRNDLQLDYHYMRKDLRTSAEYILPFLEKAGILTQ